MGLKMICRNTLGREDFVEIVTWADHNYSPWPCSSTGAAISWFRLGGCDDLLSEGLTSMLL